MKFSFYILVGTMGLASGVVMAQPKVQPKVQSTDFNAQDADGKTPLMLALEKADFEKVKSLLASNVSVMPRDKDDNNAINIASLTKFRYLEAGDKDTAAKLDALLPVLEKLRIEQEPKGFIVDMKERIKAAREFERYRALLYTGEYGPVSQHDLQGSTHYYLEFSMRHSESTKNGESDH